MTAELKPCPFCGGTDISVTEGETFRWVNATCAECGAQSGEVRVAVRGVLPSDQWRAKCDAHAFKAWNTRAPVAVQEEAREVALPQNEDQAALMALLGTNWLMQHAPHRLRPPREAGAAVDESMIDQLIRAAFDWGEGCGVDNVLWGEPGDSHNQMQEGDVIQIKSRMLARLRSAGAAAPDEGD